ncbi:MAG TPA: alpha-hydroxy acid oxidase, partial [Burkholderiales bacterium]|nr:alpha-hydroxy acid oxidase [Burkholderiales bacterium]
MKAAQALNIDELRALARRRLPRVMADYLDGGAEDHVTLQANRAAFEALRFAPRTLVDVSRRSQKATLFGRVYESPVGIAPIGACGLFRHEGDIALARAARSANIPFVASTHAFVPLRRLAWEAGGPPWYQLYLPPSRELARKMVQHAADAGCEALVLTTDVPVGGKREYNDRNGFGMPLRVSARMVADALAHPRWLLGVFARAWLAQDYAMLVPEWHTRRDYASWSDLAWLRETWKGKLLVKGVLCVEDAQLAAEHGADGIWVSNHGGRQLDG